MGTASRFESRTVIDVHASDDHPERARAELTSGLVSRPRRIPSHYFYDATGSRLFDQITQLPEYYLTRAEAAILRRDAAAIIERTEACELVELGSGSSTKTRILLDAMAAAGTLRRYVPFDVSEAAVREAVATLEASYSELRIHGVVGEFDRHLSEIPLGDRRLVLLIGSTIGNFDLDGAKALIGEIARPMEPGDFFLLGVDLVKDVEVLEAAYNDRQGVTARFNLNILDVLNTKFDGDFRTELFEHRAVWDPEREWIEMRLVATREHRVRLVGLDLELDIAAGERIVTEISSKYRREVAVDLLCAGGFELTEWMTDGEGQFALALARRL